MNFKNPIFVYENGGDQEDRLISIERPVLILPKKEDVTAVELKSAICEHGELYAMGMFAEEIIPIDRLITIGNYYFNEDNEDPRDDVDEVEAELLEERQTAIGLKYNDMGTTHYLGFTVIVTDAEKDHDGARKVWIVNKKYDEVLKIALDNVRRLIKTIDDSDEQYYDIFVAIINYVFEGFEGFNQVNNILVNENGEYFPIS